MFVCCILLSVSMTCMTLFKLLMQKEQQRGGFSASQGLSREGTKGTAVPIRPASWGHSAHRRGPAASLKAGAAPAASTSCSFMSSACCLFCVPDV